ncbi:MAG: hypothetical protein KGD70_03575 [Candidatus Lokiarchaeota archaeon]|jgi:hypothetical protein|nr:hypothetical protein [Candidatus Lokiarchaeota archaeon]
MSKLQETDLVMRIMAIASGIVALIEAVLKIMGVQIAIWGWGWIGGAVALLLAILVILLGIKPIHYTPVFLGILGVGIIFFGVLIGGIIVLVATILGAIT